jgi:hypothetical protein
MRRRQFQRQREADRQRLLRTTVRRHLNADALNGAVRKTFEQVPETGNGDYTIPLTDCLMSGYAMFSLKDSSLLAFDRRRIAEPHNLESIFGIKQAPCDTQMRTRLDLGEPDSLRPAYKEVFRRAQRGKLLEEMVFMEGCVLVSGDGTTYFVSEKLSSPACLRKISSKTGKITYSLQTYAAVIVHPDRKEVIPLPAEPIFNHDGDNKNDCERNACRRWLEKFRKDHPHLKVIITEDGLSSNAPHIRDLIEHRCHFILGFKEGDHAYLSACLDAAVEKGEAIEYDIQDPENPKVHHFFRFMNHVPINASNQDLLVNVLEYWEESPHGTQRFCWVMDFTITRENAYSIMRGGRARWKVENETFNTLKNQGYHFEHNYGLGKKNLSQVFVMLMMLAFLVDQVQQLACPLFHAAWKVSGPKKELWENMRSVFRYVPVESMEMLYRVIVAGPQKLRPVFLDDTS